MATAIRIDDTVDTCDCCGRTGLKRTVLMRLDDDSIVNYGTTCAARNTGKSHKQIKQEVYAEQDRIKASASWDYRTSPECRALRNYRTAYGSSASALMSEEEEQLLSAARAAKRHIAASYGLPYGSF